MPHVSPLEGRKKGERTASSGWSWPRLELPFGLLTDAATRLAGELEDGAAKTRKAPDGRVTVEHLPTPSPEGCADDYRVQFSQASSLVIWCSTAGNVRKARRSRRGYRGPVTPVTQSSMNAIARRGRSPNLR